MIKIIYEKSTEQIWNFEKIIDLSWVGEKIKFKKTTSPGKKIGSGTKKRKSLEQKATNPGVFFINLDENGEICERKKNTEKALFPKKKGKSGNLAENTR